MEKICILGATGSVGTSTLDVIAQYPNLYEAYALTAHTHVERLFEQCQKFHPKIAVMVDLDSAQKLKDLIQGAKLQTEVWHGEAALQEVASLNEVDKVMAAIVGAKGLLSVLSAVKAGKTVLIANKEPLVMAGEIIVEASQKHGACLLPVDSEHNAVFQCLGADYQTGAVPESITSIHLTASGGPFLDFPAEQFDKITPEQAIKHPTWQMGPKISTDCATLMNKGLEVIEACRLFQMSAENVQVIIHPESRIHAMVEYTDGAYLAQMGPNDMRCPISYALSWPNRLPSRADKLDLLEISQLSFRAPDKKKFRCLELAYQSAQAGGCAPVVLNASNEVAVHAFLNHQVRFDQIPAIIESVLDKLYDIKIHTLEDVLNADELARNQAYRVIKHLL